MVPKKQPVSRPEDREADHPDVIEPPVPADKPPNVIEPPFEKKKKAMGPKEIK
jgi:hypothetical protein